MKGKPQHSQKKYLPEPTLPVVSRELLIIKDFQSIITCSICFNIFNAPVTLHCGHSFCRECIIQCSKSECCICKKVFTKHSLPQKNIILSQLINSQEVVCPTHFDTNTEPCCTANLTIETIQAHVLECGNITLRCECGTMIPKKKFFVNEVKMRALLGSAISTINKISF